MEAVEGAVLYSSFDVLFGKTSSEVNKFARQNNFLAELDKLRPLLVHICGVLNDAEGKQLSRESIKVWLLKAKHLIYDAENVLDELVTQASRRRLKGGSGSQFTTSKVSSLIPPFCASLVLKGGIRQRLRQITTRLEAISAQIDVFGLEKGAAAAGTVLSAPVGSSDFATTPLVEETVIYGRDYDRERIVELLCSNTEISESNVCVISIVGMGGVGKTTLAQLVYNDIRVKEHFNIMAWVCVSDDFDATRITNTILGSITRSYHDLRYLEQAQAKLSDALAGRRFLLVLDDVWNEALKKWDLLRSPFAAGAEGSKIIVTTRSQATAMVMGSAYLYHLMVLSVDDSWLLFSHHAFKNQNMDEHPNLAVAKEITNKCRGLPLVIKALGQLLQSRPFDQWETVLNNTMWTEADDYMLPHLRLSYYYLPFHLKRCFTFCAIFPMDYEFEVNDLVFLWMAEGLIQQPAENRQMEDLGVEYFHELLSRSFFQQSSDESKFVMHDLICDLARSLGGDMYCIWENAGNYREFISERTYHFSYIGRLEDVPQLFETFKEVNYLRTFLAISPIPDGHDAAVCGPTTRVLNELLTKFKYLRILSLRGCQVRDLPNSISSLMYLRYLNLSQTAVERLPDSVGTLFNLQTLLLHGCKRLNELPQNIGNLVNLRHLDIRDTDQLQELPPQIGNLITLRTLSKFIVSKGSSLRITALRNLSQLRGKLSVLGLQNAGHIWSWCDAILRDTEGLEELMMEWLNDFSDSRNEKDELHVLDLLEPHTNLKKLTVSFYGGSKFPSWTGSSSFSRMVDLNLINCRNCTSLPSLGQLSSLKSLCITGMAGLKRVGAEFYGDVSSSVKPFSSLKTLKFEDMPEWQTWSFPYLVEEAGAFPCLDQLTLINCPKLMKLPCHPPSLVDQLTVCECAELAIPLQRLASVSNLSVTGCYRAHLSTRDAVDLSAVINTFNIQEIPSLTDADKLERFLENLQHLEIYDCVYIEKLPDELHRLVSLTDMRIEQCPKLVSLPGIFPAELRRLSINCCENLELVPDGILTYGNSSNSCLLEHLEIRNCPSLICFPTGDIRNSLQQLEIEHCVNLESLPEGIMQDDSSNHSNTCRLQVLKLYRCPALRSFPAGKLPSTLKQLEIWDCTQLEGISEKMLHNNTSLECLDFWNYPNLKTLPGSLTPYLKNLHIGSCVNFEFQSHLMQSLSSLQSLCIRRCPGLESLKGGDLSPSLISLQIEDCKNLKSPLSEWSLHRLTSLTVLRIGGLFPDVVSFSVKEGFPLLPTTLIHLSIDRIQNLESVVSLGFQNLTSLKELRFIDCLKLSSFLPSEGLLSTVSMLFIRNCPLLSRRCSRNGEDWPKIAHIPYIRLYS